MIRRTLFVILIGMVVVAFIGCGKDKEKEVKGVVSVVEETQKSIPDEVSKEEIEEPPKTTKQKSPIPILESRPVTPNWQSPSIAINYLVKEGLSPRGYKYESGNTYYAASPYREIGSGFPLANNIAYYVEGSRAKAKELKLVLNVNVSNKSKEAHAELLRYSEILYQKALSEELPPKIKTSVINGESGRWDSHNVTAELSRDDWATGKGYELRFTITEKSNGSQE